MIKESLDKGNYSIILDTNVFLHIYQYSPDYCKFALDCLSVIKEHIILPSFVQVEFSRHSHKSFIEAKKKVESAIQGPTNQLKSVSAKMLAACDTLEQFHYPDVDELREGLKEKFEEISSYLNDFFSERPEWTIASNSFGERDILGDFVKKLLDNDQGLEAYSLIELLNLCDEGKARYESKTPPGYKDNKKDGIRKYGDFIIWKEVLRFAAKVHHNIIFVTDDVKNDWWDEDETGAKVFSVALTEEFKRKTKQSISPFGSKEFFDDIATDYGIEKPQMFELALDVNLEALAEKVADDVFTKIESALIYSNSDYVEDSDIGTEGIDEFEIEEYKYIGVEKDYDYIGEYIFTYNVTLSGISYDYWGRDDDTKEIILSPGRIHTFEGILQVEVSRDVDDLMNFDSFIITEASIRCGKLKQTTVEDLSFGDDFDDYSDGPVCLDCGSPLTEEDGNSGYCRDCSINH